jgi:hypothetical protein
MSIYDKSGFLVLVRAHDHVWHDRTTPLKIRMEACVLLHRLSLQCEIEMWEKREAEIGRCQLGLSYQPNAKGTR